MKEGTEGKSVIPGTGEVGDVNISDPGLCEADDKGPEGEKGEVRGPAEE